MSLRLYNVTTTIPKYVSGHWKWNESLEQLEFFNTTINVKPDCELPAPKLKFGIQFKDYMNEIEENIFRQIFRRPDYSNDSDVITIQDIKDVALFTAPADSVSNKFIKFLHTETCDLFLNDLIIYFEYFLKLVEFLLIRRDELKIKIRDMKSVQIERMLAEYLVQYRLILARDYSNMVLGQNDLIHFHHLANKSKQSNTVRDSIFYETFMCFCVRIIWIAMHRKAYSTIDFEMNRLFRSGHFNVAEKQLPNCLKFTIREQQLLYGPNDFRCNYRNQQSPLILELLKIKPKNTDVLWIGKNKYRGTDPRLFQLELEYVTPDAQLSFVDCHHGILGNPKSLYNTMLALDWHAVRDEKFTDFYDPYQLVRQPHLKIPDWKLFNKTHQKSKPYFQIVSKKFEPDIACRQVKLWQNKEFIIRTTGIQHLQGENILKKCQDEIDTMDRPVVIDRDQIIATFLAEKERILKKK